TSRVGPSRPTTEFGRPTPQRRARLRLARKGRSPCASHPPVLREEKRSFCAFSDSKAGPFGLRTTQPGSLHLATKTATTDLPGSRIALSWTRLSCSRAPRTGDQASFQCRKPEDCRRPRLSALDRIRLRNVRRPAAGSPDSTA